MVMVHRWPRVVSHVSTPCARRNTHTASANAPITTTSRLIHVSVVVAGMLPATSVNPSAFLRSTAGLASGEMAGARRAVALRDQQLLERDQARVREEDAHACRGGRGDAAADEEDADQRADRDARDENARSPEQEFPQEERETHVVGVHQQHRNQRQVVGAGEREEHEDLRREPVAAFNGRREDALDETIGARARDRAGRERDEPKGTRQYAMMP